MHRDLKFENIMLKKVTENFFLPVIVDFGLAELTDSQILTHSRCGTPGYVAPEIFKAEPNLH